MTKGNRLNNPGCIRDLNDSVDWKGKIGVDETKHVIFDTLLNGSRALWRVIEQKLSHGHDTPKSFAKSYADSADTQGSIPGGKPNQPDKYAAYIAKKVGIVTDANIFFQDFKKAILLWQAICEYENAGWCPPLSIQLESLGLFYRDFVEK